MSEIKLVKPVGHSESIIKFLRIVRELKGEGRSFLLYGPEGVGKKLSALYGCASLFCEKGGEFACLNCRQCRLVSRIRHPDLIFIEPQSKGEWIKVSDIREYIHKTIKFAPFEAKWKFYIIDRAERLNVAAQNALLKVLEEPPPGHIFVLITQSPWQILPTVRSRTVSINFRKLSKEEFFKVLSYLNEKGTETDYILSQGSPGRFDAVRFKDPETIENLQRFLRFLLKNKLEAVEIHKILSRYFTNQRNSVIFLEDLSLLILNKIKENVIGNKGGVDKSIVYLLDYMEVIKRVKRIILSGGSPALAINKLISYEGVVK